MEPTASQSTLTVSEESVQHLASIRTWAFFLAVMGFLGAGFMVLMGLIVGVMGNAFMPEAEDAGPVVGILLGSFYAIFGLVYAIPAYFLLRFSTIVKEAIVARASDRLTLSLRFLRSYFTFNGIALIVALGLGVAVIMIAVVIALIGAMPA